MRNLDQVIKYFLKPIIKLILARGITYPYFIEMLKPIFIEVALNDFQIEGKEQTNSRISLLTGVHRKDVKKLTQISDSLEPTYHKVVPIAARLIAAWTSLENYTDNDGLPLLLPKSALKVGRCSFEGLVELITKDVRSRTLLDELLTKKIVRINEKDCVELLVHAFIPEHYEQEKLFYLGHNLHDHAAAATSNILGGKQPWLECSVHYDALNSISIEELHHLATKLSMQALQTINRKSMALEKDSINTTEAKQRMTFGIYFYSEPTISEISKIKDEQS